MMGTWQRACAIFSNHNIAVKYKIILRKIIIMGYVNPFLDQWQMEGVATEPGELNGGHT